MTATLPHLIASVISTGGALVSATAALYTVTLTIIALTAVFARTPDRRHAAQKTLATLIRRRSL